MYYNHRLRYMQMKFEGEITSVKQEDPDKYVFETTDYIGGLSNFY